MISWCKKFLLLLSFLITVCVHGAASEQNPVSVQLISENSTIERDSTFWMIVKFNIDPGWHIYWENPGDAGAPPHITWKLPQGFTAQEPLFATPKQFTVGDAVGFGYDTQVSLLVPIHSADTLHAGDSCTLEATVTYVACKTLCVPGRWEGSATLHTTPKSTFNQSQAPLFEAARKALPKVVADISLMRDDGTVEVSVPLQESAQSISNVQFFPKTAGIVNLHHAPTWSLQDDGKKLIAFLPLAANIADPESLDGILLITLNGADHLSIALNKPIKRKPVPSAKFESVQPHESGAPNDASKHVSLEQAKEFFSKEAHSLGQLMTKDFLVILFFAFIGGMILNLMPCVLPVISIKLVHYIKMRGASYSSQLKQGLVFSLGILISFWVLAGIIFALQAAGKTVGWGFQLQEPLFVASLIIVIFILSLSLFGVFEFGLKVASLAQEIEEHGKIPNAQDRPPTLWSSFLSGVLATFVATPCTGPLLGSTLGLTATLNPVFSFLIFTALGIGMAFPYLMISLFPGFASLIPRPGRWMVTFKQLMGFFMMATVVWLVWVLAAETTNLSLIHILGSFFIMSFGLWIYGTWGGFDRGRGLRAVARVIALLTILFGGYVLIHQVYIAKSKQHLPPHVEDWLPFSSERLQELKKDNIVFVNFTAKWCLTCQANKVILESRAVREAFVANHVVKLVADWTDGDEEITKFMRSIGRNGVPVYAIYKKGSDQPQILPELLTQEIVIQAIENAAKQ